MIAARRIDQALVLTAAAVFGLVAAPLLHAEEHWQEAHEDEVEAREAWEAASPDPADRLALALTHPGRDRPAPHHHSHRGDGHGPHGDGTLAHLSVALHAAPGLPALEPPRPAHRAPVPIAAQLRETLRYLVPAFAQGPPARC